MDLSIRSIFITHTWKWDSIEIKDVFSNNIVYTTQMRYRSGTVNSNTVNSKFHLIRSCCEYLARFLSFHV